MKNSTFSYTYTVELSIQHPSRELSSFAKELSKIPLLKVGKKVPKEMYGKLSQPYDELKTTGVSVCLEDGWFSALTNNDLPTEVDALLDAIYTQKKLLIELADAGGKNSMRIGLSHQSNVGTTFYLETIQKLSELKISLDFFLYVGDKINNLHYEELDKVAEKMRTILHKYDPSEIIDKSLPLSELHHDPYQDLFNLLPLFIKAHASKELIANELKEELGYFVRTNTLKLKEFQAYDALADELFNLKWE